MLPKQAMIAIAKYLIRYEQNNAQMYKLNTMIGLQKTTFELQIATTLTNCTYLELNKMQIIAFYTKFATLAARAVLVSLFFFKQLIKDYLTGNSHLDSPICRGV